MKIWQEFKAFAMRGNVIDLAVGIIIGTAFTNIVNSLVKNVITPPIGWLIGGKAFEKLTMTLPEVTIPVPNPEKPTEFIDKVMPPVEVGYGAFLQATFDFLIIAICVFLLIKLMNMLIRKKEEAPKPAELSTQEKLLTEIRDLLQQRGPAA